jgi:hypothetical protein
MTYKEFKKEIETNKEYKVKTKTININGKHFKTFNIYHISDGLINKDMYDLAFLFKHMKALDLYNLNKKEITKDLNKE